MEKLFNSDIANQTPFLKTEDVFAGYGKKEILRGISLKINKAEIVALIGPNGAGKSTLLKVISGMLKITKGSVWFNGKELKDIPTHQRVKEGILHFLQGGPVFPSLTVKENLEMGGRELSSEKRKEALNEITEFFPELKANFNRRAGLLSGGQRQMLALGTILMQQPKLLLLDEPSAGLAPNLVGGFMEKIEELNHLFQITVLLVEQNIEQALQVSQRAYVLVNGKVQAEYTEPKQLLSSEDLEKIFFQENYLS